MGISLFIFAPVHSQQGGREGAKGFSEFAAPEKKPKLMWKADLLSRPFQYHSPVFGGDGTMYFASISGHVFAYAPNGILLLSLDLQTTIQGALQNPFAILISIPAAILSSLFYCGMHAVMHGEAARFRHTCSLIVYGCRDRRRSSLGEHINSVVAKRAAFHRYAKGRSTALSPFY